jgi:hypothetical protein
LIIEPEISLNPAGGKSAKRASLEIGAMKKEFADSFNENVERYRMALLDHARKCDWDRFTAKAGNLFDYVEVVEVSEIERRFFRVFKSVLVVLVAVIAAIANMDPSVHPDLGQVRYSITVLAVAGTCFELYTYLTFRSFMITKSISRNKRKERFVRGIEWDFRQIDFSNQRQERQAA